MPDNISIIGKGSAEGTFRAIGFFAHGFELSAIVGKIISQLIVNGKSELPIEAFSVDRFG